jgi:hypothetical protein
MMSVKELFKSKYLLSDISSFDLQNYFRVFFIVWAQIFWHSRISLFPNGQPATKVAWLSSPKRPGASSILGAKYSTLKNIVWYVFHSIFFLFSHLITYHFAILRFGMYLQTFLQRNFPINTYHFVNYQFGMYLQTNFPINLLFHTYQIANTPVWYVFVNCKYLFSYRKYIPFG